MPGGGDLSISVNGRHGEVFVVIKDSGQGIPKESLEKIFTPYYTSKTGGTGLGLAISARLTRLMGGQIWAESKVGEGTTISCLFPIAQDSTTDTPK